MLAVGALVGRSGQPQVLTDSSGSLLIPASGADTLSEPGCHGSGLRGTVTASVSSDCCLGSPTHSCYGCPWLSHSILGHPGAETGERERERTRGEPGGRFHPQVLQHDL